MSTRLEDVVEPNHIALDVGIGILDAIAHTCLSSQIHNHRWLIFSKQRIYCCLIGYIATNEKPFII